MYKVKTMTINELKEYIYNQNKIEYILKQLGCHSVYLIHLFIIYINNPVLHCNNQGLCTD